MHILRKFSIRKLQMNCSNHKFSCMIALVILLLFSILLSLRCGSQNFSFAELLNTILQRQEESTTYRILMHVRIPRTCAAMLAGGALALSGALIQTVLNNAMASPNVIGVNAGAGFFAMVAVTLFPQFPNLMPVASFLGALLTALFIYSLAIRAGISRSTLILAGVAVSSILTAGVNTLTLLYPDDVIGATGFMLGGFSGVTMKSVQSAVLYLVVGLVLALFLAVDLNVLQLGEESACGLGVHVKLVRFLAILSAALLAGAAVSFAGLLGFVGLLVPHIARKLIGNDNRLLFPASALLGASFVLLCDVIARVLFSPFELPVGIVMSLLGGPFFLSLLLRQKRGRVYD